MSGSAEADDRGRYERAAAALSDYDGQGYSMYLSLYLENRERQGTLTDDDAILRDVLEEWRDLRTTPGPDPDVSLLRRWLAFKQRERDFPTVERDLSKHGKCVGCGANDYTCIEQKGGCSCPLGLGDPIYYDCLGCGAEYTGHERVEKVPLCPDCFDRKRTESENSL